MNDLVIRDALIVDGFGSEPATERTIRKDCSYLDGREFVSGPNLCWGCKEWVQSGLDCVVVWQHLWFRTRVLLRKPIPVIIGA